MQFPGIAARRRGRHYSPAAPRVDGARLAASRGLYARPAAAGRPPASRCAVGWTPGAASRRRGRRAGDRATPPLGIATTRRRLEHRRRTHRPARPPLLHLRRAVRRLWVRGAAATPPASGFERLYKKAVNETAIRRARRQSPTASPGCIQNVRAVVEVPLRVRDGVTCLNANAVAARTVLHRGLDVFFDSRRARPRPRGPARGPRPSSRRTPCGAGSPARP